MVPRGLLSGEQLLLLLLLLLLEVQRTIQGLMLLSGWISFRQFGVRVSQATILIHWTRSGCGYQRSCVCKSFKLGTWIEAKAAVPEVRIPHLLLY